MFSQTVCSDSFLKLKCSRKLIHFIDWIIIVIYFLKLSVYRILVQVAKTSPFCVEILQFVLLIVRVTKILQAVKAITKQVQAT